MENESWAAFAEAGAKAHGVEVATVATLFPLAGAMLPQVLGDKSERSQHIRLRQGARIASLAIGLTAHT